MGEPKLPPPGTPPLMVSTPAELEKLIGDDQ